MLHLSRGVRFDSCFSSSVIAPLMKGITTTELRIRSHRRVGHRSIKTSPWFRAPVSVIQDETVLVKLVYGTNVAR